MPLIRNPFSRRPFSFMGGDVTNDENARPSANTPRDGFEKVDTIGSKASSAWSIRTTKGRDNGDYKMSVVNDSGVYLPPSPTEEKGLWPRRPAPTRTSIDQGSNFGEIEHFSISRESFDSYRRSFDISARSPIVLSEPPRQSFDSSALTRIPRSSVRRNFEGALPTAEEDFEDVGLNDEQKQQNNSINNQQSKRKSFFANTNGHSEGLSRFIPGRKRAQSGQGAELSAVERPKSSQSNSLQLEEA